jgi:hypothetical protein
MTQALAQFKSGCEALTGEFVLAEALVGNAAEVQAVRFSPGVLAIGFFRQIERFAGVLKCFVRVARGDTGLSQGEPEVNGIFSETAGVGQEDAGFGFFHGLRVISEMPLNNAGCNEATELELDVSRAAGESTGML